MKLQVLKSPRNIESASVFIEILFRRLTKLDFLLFSGSYNGMTSHRNSIQADMKW